MPVLKTERSKKTVTLPQSEAKVTLWETILAGDIASGLTIDKAKSSLSALDIVTALIAEWDFTDEKNNPLPVEKEFVELLSVDDFTFLMGQVNNITEENNIDAEVKKNI